MDNYSLQGYMEELAALTNLFLSWVAQPIVWYQAGIIVSCFVLARWALGPLLRKLINSVLNLAPSSLTLQKMVDALSQISVPAAWLLLSWTGLWTLSQLGLTYKLLLTTNSLLTAWVIIQLLSNFIRNEAVSHTLALTAWLVAALNIFGWLNIVTTTLDSWAITVGTVNLSVLLVIKTVLSLSVAVWLATVVTEV
ncbi:MAG: hypothetical protein ACI9KN_000616, partial [Gammaproteobacteria bacterium]